MADIAFVFTNPGHHLEMMVPVERELARRGRSTSIISLAELRGFRTPEREPALQRAIPFNIRPRPTAPSARKPSTTKRWRPGPLAQRAVWRLLGLRMRSLIGDARVVVVPNDAVFPYLELLAELRSRGVRVVLMQEGIRFKLPAEYDGLRYGGGQTSAVCAWGEAGREYFIEGKVGADKIVVTGAPRFDGLDPPSWTERGLALRAKLGLDRAPIAFLSNPIEIQGYGDKKVKLDLFERFLRDAAPVLARRGMPMIVKTHLHEDPNDFAKIAAASPIARLVQVIDAPIFAAISASGAAIVLTSTVGLEALAFGKSLGVLEIPGHGFGFEYVQHGAAVPLASDQIAAGLDRLLEVDPQRTVAAQRFLERHLYDRGRSRYNVADVIERLADQAKA